MQYKEELELFLTTGISFFSMLAYLGIGKENVLMEVLFWIVPQYIVIIYPQHLYSTIAVLCVIIATRHNKILRDDWKECLIDAKNNILCNKNAIVINQRCNKDKLSITKALSCECGKKNDRPHNKTCWNTYIEKESSFRQQIADESDVCLTNDEFETKKMEFNDGLDDLDVSKEKIMKLKGNPSINTDIIETLGNAETFEVAKTSIFYPIIVSYRAYINLMVIISIFACDFPFFPQKHLKTDFYGLSLMDVGIGAYLFNNGCLHSYKTGKTLRTALLLFILGCVRLLTLHITDYKVNITEYGKHLNFYFTLSFTYLLSMLRIPPRMGLLIMISYEILLRNRLDVFIFTEKRDTFFLQNKEGIFQLIPSLCIFIFTRKISNLKKNTNNTARLLGLIKTTGVFIVYYLICSRSSAPSRRLGNFCYVSWILALHSLHLSLTFVAGYFTKYRPMKLHVSCSDNFMFTFLFANLIILACNLLNVQRMNGHVVMASYLIAVFVVPYYVIRHYKNKLKE